MIKTKEPHLIEAMVESIRNKIIIGEYAPGFKLSENTLAKEFNCSRTPIREVIKRLEQDGLVKVIPHSGSYVYQRTAQENIEMIEVRASLERLAFRLACDNNSSLTAIIMLCEQMNESLLADPVDYKLYGKLHYLFHRQLIELSKNNLLLELYDRLNLNNTSALFSGIMNEEEIALTIAEHNEILNLLKQRDKQKGCSFMFSHLWKKRNRIKH